MSSFEVTRIPVSGEGRAFRFAVTGLDPEFVVERWSAHEEISSGYAIEVDVQLTSDDVPVIYHDRTLTKVSGSRRVVSDCSLQQLAAVDFGRWFSPRFAGEAIPTLDAVLRRFAKRTCLLVEIKVDAKVLSSARRRRLVDKTVHALVQARPPEAWVLSFDPAALRRVAASGPRLRRVLNVDAPPPMRRLVRTLQSVDALCLPARFVSRRLVDVAHEQQRQLWVYRCDTSRNLEAAKKAGVDAIITDWPGRSRTQLGLHKRARADKRATPSRERPTRSRSRGRAAPR